MKKLYFTESQMRNHLLCEGMSDYKLPKFLFDKIKNHKSFLGDNAAFPPEEDYPFDYKVLKTRYKEVYDNIVKLNLDSLEYDYLISLLSKLIKECKEIEKPLRQHLCKVCENAVIELFKIPAETVNLTCELVGKVEPKNHSYRTLPETSEHRDFEFEDMEEFHNVSKVVLKRRLINSLIQGASYTYALNYDLYLSQIYKLDKRLLDLYDKILVINDYLLFLKEVKIDDKSPMQSAYVEVELGKENNRTDIFAQGIIFPFLLMETIRGFFELFASHGLPSDNKKALYIIKQADFLTAEPWDLRMGVGLWNFIGKSINNTKVLPYLFSSLCEMKVDEFNSFLQEVFAQTKKGKTILQELIDDSQDELERFEFLDTMKQKNAEKAVITDGDFSLEELQGFAINEEDDIETPEELDELIPDNEDISPLLLGEVDPSEITFEVGSATPSWYKGARQMYQLYPVVDGIEFDPTMGINLRAEEVVFDGDLYYQLHIYVAEELRRQNIAYNLYKAVILNGYPVCSLSMNHTEKFNRHHNVETPDDDAIPNLWDKLSTDSAINVSPLYNVRGKEIGVKAIVSECRLFEDMAYHGSPNDFATFDIAYANKGFGQVFGYGIYLTFDKEMAKGYARDGGQVFTVEIPSDESATYLKMNEPVPNEVVDLVKSKLFEMNLDTYIEDYEDEAEYTLNDDLDTWFPYDIIGKHFYYSIDKFTDSERETSELLASCGVVGYKYTDGSSDCVVMFSDEYIDIIQKEINESYNVILEYMSSWREDNIHTLVDSIYNDLESKINKSRFTRDYDYELQGVKSNIQIMYKPIKGSTSSRWNGEYFWLTNQIVINLEGNISKEDVGSAVHHEITHYMDMMRQRQAQQNLYPTYGSDYIKSKDPNVKLVNTIIYKLWDKLELNAYQSFAMYGYQYIIDYCKELEDKINILERSKAPNSDKLWLAVKEKFRPNAQMDWQTFKAWFIKRSRLALDKFKKKALKNAYLYQDGIGDGSDNSRRYVPDNSEIPNGAGEPEDMGDGTSGEENGQTMPLSYRLQLANARFLSFGVQIEKIRNSQPIALENEGQYREYQGVININKEQMPLYVIEDVENDKMIISIPDTEIIYELVYQEYDRNTITNRRYVGLGKILSSMYKQYDKYKKELEKQNQQNQENSESQEQVSNPEPNN